MEAPDTRRSSRFNAILAVTILIASIQALANIRTSMSSRFNDAFELGLDYDFISAPRTDNAGNAVATAIKVGETKEGKNGEANRAKQDGQTTQHQEIPLTLYSYNTTNFDEFSRLNHAYLLSQQQKLGDSHLSTRARDNDIDGNLMTTARWRGSRRHFIAGFRNQIIHLTSLVMEANHDGHKQFDLSRVRHKDTYGTEKAIFFYDLFDVEHWNKYSFSKERAQKKVLATNTANPERYPNWLPRMVFYNDTEYQGTTANNTVRLEVYHRKTAQMFGRYRRYAKGKGPLVPHPIGEENRISAVRNPAEILMYQGALRPHPALQAVVDRLKLQMMKRGRTSSSSSFRYMTLHARIEPDMQKHPVCRDKKVLTLQEIVNMIEAEWSEPPVDVVFLPINRQYLAKEGTLPENFKNNTNSTEEINWLAVHNLELLNRLTNHDGSKDGKPAGLWNGKVPVVEFGAEALEGTVYAERPSISGSILNYFLAVDATIFIGTEVSSYSNDIVGARFYRESGSSYTSVKTKATNGEPENLRKNNYKYLPTGLKEWVTDEMVVPPNFDC